MAYDAVDLIKARPPAYISFTTKARRAGEFRAYPISRFSMNITDCNGCFIIVGLAELSLGAGHSLLLKQDGSVWGTGANNFGQLGLGLQTAPIYNFVELFSGGVIAIAAGDSGHTMVVRRDGSVWTTGRNHEGQLGDGSNKDQTHFFKAIGIGVKAVAAGFQHSLAVHEDGSVWATGCNEHGQLGDGSITKYKRVFEQVRAKGAKAVAAGVEHSLILNQDGSVWSTGGNDFGQLGDGTNFLKRSFVKVLSAGAKAIAAGGYHSLVLKKDGSVWAMGNNKYGQIGDGTRSSSQTIYAITRDMHITAKAIAAGFLYSMVLGKDGSVWVTGRNNHGQLGDGSTVGNDILTPLMIDGAEIIATGAYHSMILKNDGGVWATGVNNEGQLGDGTTISKTAFVRVAQTSSRGV